MIAPRTNRGTRASHRPELGLRSAGSRTGRSPPRAIRMGLKRTPRQAFTLMEMIAAATLLAALMTVCVPMLGAIAAHRRAASQRQCAIQEAANAMEHLAAADWESLKVGASPAAQLSPEARRALPDGSLTVEIASPPQEPGAKRITITVRWEDPAGRRLAPLRLVAWRHQIRPEDRKGVQREGTGIAR